MSKIFKRFTLLVLVGILISSCTKSKINDSVALLDKLPVFITNDKANHRVTMENDTITVTLPDQGQLYDKEGNPVDDDMVVNTFLHKMFCNNITAFLIADSMGTKEGESPIEDFLSAVESQNIPFLIIYKDKKIELSADDVRKILKS